MKMTHLTIACLIGGMALAALADEVDTSKLPPPSDKKDLTFDKDIKPIFENSCVKCHSGEKPKARLRLDTLENVLAGTPKEKVLKPGNSADSILVHNIARIGEDEDEWMPPPKNRANIGPLTPEEIGLIRAWIDQGAK